MSQGFTRLFKSAVGIGVVSTFVLAGCASHKAADSDTAVAAKTSVTTKAKAADDTMTPDQAFARLQEGNAHFVAGTTTHPQEWNHRLATLAEGQKPWVIVLACSDSRVPPELLFDTGLGEVFVMRVAGNTAQPVVVGSIEYAVSHLGSPLLVVLGHEQCGAVSAALQTPNPADAPGDLPAVLTPIAPVAKQFHGYSPKILDEAVHANVAHVVQQLNASSAIIAPAVQAGKLKIVGGYYDFETGKVTFDIQ